MQSITNKKLSNRKTTQQSSPFAKALAESEKSSYDGNTPRSSSSDLSEAFAKAGGQFPDLQNKNSTDFLQQQQQELLEKQKKEALRKKLHDQINPVDAKDIFSARKKQVAQEIDELRQELKLLVTDVSQFKKDVEITLMTEVVDPGQQGKYFFNFFRQLRAFIILLRQKIKSARTWAHTFNQKSKKKKRKTGGMVIEGLSHEKTATVQNQMHHERSSSYGGS